MVLRLQDTSAEIRVRAAVVLLLGFVVLAERFGLETILGALLAGAVIGAVDKDTSTHPQFRDKLDAIGFGFLIPVFFVVQRHPAGHLRPGLRPGRAGPDAGVRGRPARRTRRCRHSCSAASSPDGRRSAAGLLQATSLPFLVTASMIGVETGLMSGVNAAALVSAGVVSVLIFPVVALGLLRGTSTDETSTERTPG